MRFTKGARRRALVGLLAAAVAVVAVPVFAATLAVDFGAETQTELESRANDLYGGVGTPLASPAVPGSGAGFAGTGSVALASGLTAELVTPAGPSDPAGALDQRLGQNADMIAFWPSDDRPTWAIVCIENGETIPGVQRVRLRGPQQGKVETILTGTRACDGIRRTPWNTILATEEVLPPRGSATTPVPGNAIEIYDPIDTTGVLFDRTTGVATGQDAANVVARPAIGRFSWEGLQIFDDGSLIAGNELGPIEADGRGSDNQGGALYKFEPGAAAAGCPRSRFLLRFPRFANCSPFAVGSLYALQVGGPTTSVGQGNERGLGKWVGPIDPAIATSEAKRVKATGFWRPEDLHADPFPPDGVDSRVCWTNTGNADLRNYGEVLCLNERAADPASFPTGAQPEVVQFIVGNPDMNQPDNLDFQPITGIAYVIEDTPSIDVDGDGVPEDHPGEVWACLPDGADRDRMSDGCVRVLSVRLQGSEPTGFIFDAGGRRAYLNIQHGPNDPATPADESTFDEMLRIEGFRPGRVLG